MKRIKEKLKKDILKKIIIILSFLVCLKLINYLTYKYEVREVIKKENFHYKLDFYYRVMKRIKDKSDFKIKKIYYYINGTTLTEVEGTIVEKDRIVYREGEKRKLYGIYDGHIHEYVYEEGKIEEYKRENKDKIVYEFTEEELKEFLNKVNGKKYLW